LGQDVRQKCSRFVPRTVLSCPFYGVIPSAPTGFVRQRWVPHVLPGGTLDRRYYELCVLSELRDRSRAGDVWVAGSRQYRSFEERLISAETLRVSMVACTSVDQLRVCHLHPSARHGFRPYPGPFQVWSALRLGLCPGVASSDRRLLSSRRPHIVPARFSCPAFAFMTIPWK